MVDEFNDLDPSNFDPNNFAMDDFSQPAGKGQAVNSGTTMITLKVVNAQAAPATAQFFGAGTGIAALVSDAAITALTPLAGPPLAAAGNAANANRFYFDTNGDLVYQDAANALMRLSCTEIPYKQLLQGMLFGKFRVNRVRFTPTSDGQIDNKITFKEKTMFGKTGYEDSINPRQYFRPDQFQSKIIDIPYDWTFNQERTFSQVINAGETVTYALTITQVAKALK